VDFYRHKTTPRIGLTPLIDVVFIMLLFFLLASNFNRWQELPVEGLSTGGAETISTTIVELALFADGQIQIDDSVRYQQNDMAWVAPLLRQNSDTVFRLTPAEGVSAQVLIDTVDRLQRHDASSLLFGHSL
jgi:biopolymer transport protein ExbD